GKNAATRTITLQTEIRNGQDRVVVSGTAKVKLRDIEGIPESRAHAYASLATDKPVAIVTGASGGIGSEIARTLAQRGAVVAVNYFRNRNAAENVVESIRAGGGEGITAQADVRNRESVCQMIDSVTKQFGRLDWVVNCATGELRQSGFMDLG